MCQEVGEVLPSDNRKNEKQNVLVNDSLVTFLQMYQCLFDLVSYGIWTEDWTEDVILWTRVTSYCCWCPGMSK